MISTYLAAANLTDLFSKPFTPDKTEDLIPENNNKKSF
jgi:hypothetical protein